MLKNWLTVVFKISAASGIDLEYSLFLFCDLLLFQGQDF